MTDNNVFQGWDDETENASATEVATSVAQPTGDVFQGWDSGETTPPPAPISVGTPRLPSPEGPVSKWDPTPEEELPPGATRQPWGSQVQDMENPPEPEPPQSWASWTMENLVPIAASAAPYAVMPNLFAAALASSLIYAGTSYVGKKLFGTAEESKEAFSDIPRDVGTTAFPTTLAATALKLAPAKYKFLLSAIAAGLGMWEGRVFGQMGKKALQGEVPTVMEEIGTPQQVVLDIALGAAAQTGINKVGASALDSIAPEFLPYTKAVAENKIVPALWQEWGSLNTRLLRFLGSSEWGKAMLKNVVDPEAKQVVKTFLTKMGLPSTSGPINFSSYMNAIVKPLKDITGRSEKQISDLANEVVDKYIPKELRPKIAEEIFDYMHLSNQMTDSAKRNVRLVSSLRSIGAPEESFQVLSSVPGAGTEKGFEEALKTLPDRIGSSNQIATTLAGVLKPLHDFAEDLYGRMTERIHNSGASLLPLGEGKFMKNIRAQGKYLEESLESFRFSSAKPTAKIVTDVVAKVKEGKPLSIPEAVQLGKDVNNLLRAAGVKGEAKKRLRSLKADLVDDIGNKLSQSGMPEEAKLYSDANQQYAEMVDKLSFFDPKIEAVLPGWKGSTPLEKTQRDYLAAHTMFDEVKPENLTQYMSALGDPRAVEKIYQIRKQAEVRRILEQSTLGNTMDDQSFIRAVKESKVFSRTEKIDMIEGASVGKMHPDMTLPSMKDSLLHGDPEVWAKAKSAASGMGVSPKELEGWAIHYGLFKPAMKKGEFNIDDFLTAAKMNPQLVKTLGMSEAVKAIASQKSLFQLPKDTMGKVVAALDTAESMPAVAKLFFTKQKTFNPNTVKWLFKAIPPEHAESLRYEIFNYMLRQGGPEIDLPRAVALTQRLFDKNSRIGLDVPTTEAIFGKERATVLHNMATALNRLNNFGITDTEPMISKIVLQKASAATPSSASLYILLKDLSIMRSITKMAYQTISKLRSPEKEPKNEK